jgi:hypothetical protein
MNIEELYNIIHQDTQINRLDLVNELARCPNLFSKYLGMYQEEKLRLRVLKRKYDEMYKNRRDFYMGNASDEEYKEEMNERKALRQDVQIYLEADNKLQNQVDKIEFQKCIVDMLERTVDNLKYRSKTIDSMIQLIRFENGA